MLFEYIVGGELFTYLRNAGKFNNPTGNFKSEHIILTHAKNNTYKTNSTYQRINSTFSYQTSEYTSGDPLVTA